MPSPLARKIIVWIFLPILLATAVTEITFRFVAPKYDLTFYSSTLKTAYWALPRLVHPSDSSADSWYPMLRWAAAFHTEKSVDIYQATFLNRTIPVMWRPKFQYPPSSLLPLELLGWTGLLPQDDTRITAVGRPGVKSAGPVVGRAYRILNGTGAVLYIVNAFLIGILAWMALRSGREGNGMSAADGGWVAASAVLASLVFYPFTQAVNAGQIQTWLNLILTLSCIAWICNARAAAGVCVAMICAVKPQLGLMLLWAILWRDWRFTKGFLLAGIPVAIASLWRYGWANHAAYLRLLSELSRNGESYAVNASMNGLMHRLLFNGDNAVWSYAHEIAPFHPLVYGVTLVTSVLFMAAALGPALVQRGRTPSIFDFGVGITCFTIGSPVAWDHHYGFLMPFFVLLLARILAMPPGPPRRTEIALLVLSWTLVANSLSVFILFADSWLNVLESYRFFGGLMLLALLLRHGADETVRKDVRAPARDDAPAAGAATAPR
jgi:hypothetical protein